MRLLFIAVSRDRGIVDPAGASHLCSTRLREGIMRSLLRTAVAAGLASMTFAFAGCFASEQTLKIVVPFQAGASSDAVARLVAEHLQKSLGRPVIVENKVGA